MKDNVLSDEIQRLITDLLKDEQLVEEFGRFNRDEITAGEAMTFLLNRVPPPMFDEIPLPIVMHELAERTKI